MTLLLSFYSSYGIVFAADSAITITNHGKTTRYGGTTDPSLNKQAKLLKLSTACDNGAIIGFFGLAAVGDMSMDKWLRKTFSTPWRGARTAAEIGDHLRDALMKEVPEQVRLNNASGFHIGAFERRGADLTPVMQFVSNIRQMDTTTGAYFDFGEYRSEEHFPSHPSGPSSYGLVSPSRLKQELRSYEKGADFPHWFRNGDLAFGSSPWEGIRLAVRAIRQNLAHRGLAVPDSLHDYQQLAELVIRTAGDLYGILGAKSNAPLIEGPYASEALAWPI